MTVFVADPDVTVHLGDALDTLRQLPAGSVDCVITSPPYWGLRDYRVDRQQGLEPTPDQYVQGMVAVFAEVRRVLADHGTCWVNLGDTYNSRLDGSHGGWNGSTPEPQRTKNDGAKVAISSGLAAKQLLGIPWRVAFALQQDGWWLRADVIWAKPNPMPESVTDRPTKAHEYVFLLSKRPRYFYDAEAVREPLQESTLLDPRQGNDAYEPKRIRNRGGRTDGFTSGSGLLPANPAGRNARSVWDIATQPYPEAHFATYPEELVRRCLLAGCPTQVCVVCGKPRERLVEVGYTPGGSGGGSGHIGDANKGSAVGAKVRHERVMPQRLTKNTETVGWSDCGHNHWRTGVVLDPFLGSGTTALVARNHSRHAIGIELNPTYAELAAKRLQQLSLLANTTCG